MTSKRELSPVPRGPALVRRAAHVTVAATIVTGCAGCPGHPPEIDASYPDAGVVVGPDAGPGVGDAGIVFVPEDAGPGIGDAGISQDAPFVTDDAGR